MVAKFSFMISNPLRGQNGLVKRKPEFVLIKQDYALALVIESPVTQASSKYGFLRILSILSQSFDGAIRTERLVAPHRGSQIHCHGTRPQLKEMLA